MHIRTTARHSLRCFSTLKNRILWVDIAKGIGIALVIVGHTFLNDSLWRKLIFSFHMPLFFILAGYTFSVKPTKKVFSSSAKRLLIPYCLVFLARTTIAYARAESIDPERLMSSFLSILFASGTDVGPWGIPAAGMIWFLMALFLARLVLNIGFTFFERHGTSVAVQSAFWCAFGIVGICLGEPAKMLPFLSSSGIPEHIKLPLSFDLTMVACFFMYAGYMFRKNGLDTLLDKWWTLPVAIIIWLIGCRFSYLELAARRYDFWLCGLLGAFAGSYIMFWISRCIETRLTFAIKPLAWMGECSMLLFCIHAFDAYLAPWQTLPFVTMGIPCALLLAGLLRLTVDLMLANIFKRV